MTERKKTAPGRHNNKLAFRVGILNISIPVLIVILLLLTGFYIIYTITDDFSRRMSRQYSIEAASNFRTATNSHFVIAQQLAYSTTISRWVADVNNEELRDIALREIEGYAARAPEINIRVTFYDTMESYNLLFGFTRDAELNRVYLYEGPPRDWVLEVRDAEMPFVLNMQLLAWAYPDRIMVFTNHRMYYEGRFVGVITAGSDLPEVFDAVFGDFDPEVRRGYIIDELGMVRVDSAELLPVFDEGGFRNPQEMPEAAQNPALTEAINRHLQTMVGGVFQTRVADSEAVRLDGDFRYASIAPIIGTNWSVVVLTNETGLMGAGYLTPLIFTFVLIFVAVLIGSFLVRRMALVPLFKLTESTVNISKDTPLFGLERDDELGDLARTIHQAISREQAANNAKRNFLSNMSHEIRTPMSAIIGLTGIAKNTNDIERKNDSIQKIDKASKHLLGIINQILDMSKIEAENFEIDPHSFSFEKMIYEVVGVHSISIEEKRLNLKIDLDKALPQYIVSDEIRLAQVLTNLLTNAVKFTPEGGTITLTAKLATDDAKHEDFLRVEVADTGIGIPSEQLPHLFGDFVQVESGSDRKFGGTGLGLTISKEIIEIMDGRIWGESELGEGSRFTFEIPVQASDAADEKPPITFSYENLKNLRPGYYKGYTILLAEDIEVNCEIVIAMLEPTGAEIECAVDGTQAVQMMRDNPERYDLIFMDVQMPGMDGLTATRLIRELGTSNSKNIPIIAMTANAFKEDIDACLEAGMNDHLSKPLDLAQMMAKLDLYL